MHTKQMPDNLVFYFEPEACAAIKLPWLLHNSHMLIKIVVCAAVVLVN
jgi:hypothetical protein